ncbi:hypothetical protein Bca4012_028578 [Brassica carinata]
MVCRRISLSALVGRRISLSALVSRMVGLCLWQTMAPIAPFAVVRWCRGYADDLGGSFSIGSPALFHRCSPLSFSLALVHGSSFLL